MRGIDLLGLGHRLFPVDDCIKLLPAGIAIGCFLDTFGNGIKPLRKLLSTGKFPACRIHAWWANSHIIAPLSAVKNAALKVEKLAGEFPTVKIYLSHSCEHYEKSKEAVKRRLELIRKFAPNTIPVNCPCGSGAVIPGVVNENHPHSGKTSLQRPYIVSNDGRDLSDSEAQTFLKNHKDAEICFLWTSRFNLRDPGEIPPPPTARTKTPSKEDIKRICNLLKR